MNSKQTQAHSAKLTPKPLMDIGLAIPRSTLLTRGPRLDHPGGSAPLSGMSRKRSTPKGVTGNATTKQAASNRPTMSEDDTTMLMSLENDAFRSIRYNRNTQLENQKMALKLLDATESTLKGEGLGLESENYFKALWPLLDNEEKEESGGMNKGQSTEFNTAIIYLISFIAPSLSSGFIQEAYGDIYAKLMSSVHRFVLVAPFVRSVISLLERVLSSFEMGQWEEKPTLKELLTLLLQLAVDARPKVRKISQDSLLNLVRLHPGPVSASSADASTAVCFGGKEDILLFIMSILGEGTSRRNSNDALHLIPLLRSLLPRLRAEEITPLIAPLLRCSALGNNHLTILIHGLFIFICDQGFIGAADATRVHASLIQQQPPITSIETIPSWIEAACKSILSLSSVADADAIASVEGLGQFFQVIFDYLISNVEAIQRAVEQNLSTVYCLVKEERVARIICELMGRWLQVKNSPVAPIIIRSAADLCMESRLDPYQQITALSPLIILLGQMHDSKQAKNAALIEKTLGKFIQRCGVEAILEILPLNLDSSPGASDKPPTAATAPATPRAWILPVLRDNVSHARLEYFTTALMPLTERLAKRAREYTVAKKLNDAKVYEVIIHQIWSTLSAFMTFPSDFSSAFYKLAPVLGKLLNDDLTLRPMVANTLTSFIRRARGFSQNVGGAEGDMDGVEDPELAGIYPMAATDLSILASFSTHYLPILFNIFGSTQVEQRSYLLECIEAILSITEETTVKDYAGRVIERMTAVAATVTTPGAANVKTNSDELVSLLELSPALVRVLSVAAYDQLLGACNPILSIVRDISLQKRLYKVICELLSQEDYVQELVTRHLEALEEQLVTSYSTNLNSAVKKGRFRLLLILMPLLPENGLHWVPQFLPEVVLGTKEVNQKARLLAFELLLAMARRMSIGGVILARHSARGQDTDATLSEYMMMLIAGLAGATPHMISATIMSLARVIFDLREGIDAELLGLLLGDIIGMLQSPSREVIKSVLGFVKVATVSLDTGHFEPHIPSLVTGLLNWSNEHHQNFKVRVRHLMERLVRRFGFESIWKVTPEAHRKLLTNIRKRRERLKRQKAAIGAGGANGPAISDGASADGEREGDRDFMDAVTSAAISKTTMVTRIGGRGTESITKPSSRFENALNDSESDLNDSQDEDDGYVIPEDSILHGINLEDDDDELETALSRKLSLATAMSKPAAAMAKGVARGMMGGKRSAPALVDNDDDHVRLGEDGRIMVSEEDEQDDIALDSDDEARPMENRAHGSQKPGKRVKFASSTAASAPANKKNKKSDAKKKNDKFEPYSYLPMMRATKKQVKGVANAGAGSKSASKKTPKFYMKRA